jgi:hypothetical protein
MTMEDKEIKFWAAHPEFDVPFLKECNMDWDEIYSEYTERIENERKLGIDKIRAVYDNILSSLTQADITALEEDGTLPSDLDKIITIEPLTGSFMSKEYPDIVIGTVSDIVDAVYYKNELNIDDSDIN